MTSRIGLFPLLIALTLVFSACVAPIQPEQAEPAAASAAPPPDCLLISANDGIVRAPCGSPTIRYTATDVAVACNHIYPLDPEQAFSRTRSRPTVTGDIAVWTFGINFDLLNAKGAPIGCLTLLRSDDANQTFVPIDRGGVLVDTCATTSALPTIQDGIAHFDGSNDITCAMNLGGWQQDPVLQAYVQDAAGELDSAELARRLDESIPPTLTINYPNYTLVAALTQEEPPPCAADGECRLPIFHLDPDPASRAPLVWHHLDVVARQGGQSFTFPPDTNGCVLPADWSTSPEPAMIWRNVPPAVNDTDPPSDMEYLYRRAADRTQAVCYELGYPGFLEFWLGPSVLTIGGSLNSDGSEPKFFGELDGILIGPPDSKPPSHAQ